jgi:uncharacterized repeat protein (TIGR03803 family)
MNRTRALFLTFFSKQSLTITIGMVLFAAVASAGEEVTYRFKGGSDGYSPVGSLLRDQAGNLYGATAEGGNGQFCGNSYRIGCGTIFELTPPATPGDAWTETVLYRFPAGEDGLQTSRDGDFPNGSLVADKNGNLYGTTGGGGPSNNGTVFELERPSSPNGQWIHRVLYDFKGVPSGKGSGDGAGPSSVVFDASGNLYGTTVDGGYCTSYEGMPTCYGAVFELAAPSEQRGSWTESILYRFSPTGLYHPQAGVILDEKGNLYGTTYLTSGVYELMPPHSAGSSPFNDGWTEKTLSDFDIPGGGAAANGTLVFDGEGNLYGTTLIGGSANEGTVFELSPPASGGAWMETVLHSFASSGDGNSPLANLIFDKAGNLYATTWEGGDFGKGTVFQLTPPTSEGGEWTETILHSFGSGADGQLPTGGLIFGLDGVLYGTASEGGSTTNSSTCLLDDYAWTCGVVFRIAP